MIFIVYLRLEREDQQRERKGVREESLHGVLSATMLDYLLLNVNVPNQISWLEDYV